ncbi:MAG: hypothetical protein Q4D58_08000 [Synergistaceae bacterium]|nr:hypothetical protein [Synergistaceae bacterium]
MHVTLENATTYIGLITFGCLVVKYVVIAPLQSAIQQLQQTVKDLSSIINDQRERIAKVETSAKQAHHRLDEHLRKE